MKFSPGKRLDPKKLKKDTVAKELVSSRTDATKNTRLPVPSPNPATNLVIAEVLVRSLANVMRTKVEKQVARVSYEDEDQAREVLDGRTVLTSLALYGAGRLAVRSRTGFAAVTGVLLAKTLYDRGKQVQKRRRKQRIAEAKKALPKDS